MRRILLGFTLLLCVGVLAGCGSDDNTPKPPPTEYKITQYGGSGNVINEWRTTYQYASNGAIVFKLPSTGDFYHYATGTIIVEPLNAPATEQPEVATGSLTVYKDDGTVLREIATSTAYQTENGMIFRPAGVNGYGSVLGSVHVGPAPR